MTNCNDSILATAVRPLLLSRHGQFRRCECWLSLACARYRCAAVPMSVEHRGEVQTLDAGGVDVAARHSAIHSAAHACMDSMPCTVVSTAQYNHEYSHS